MSQSAHEPLPPEEEVLLDYARRLSRFRAGRLAIHVHLSRLRPYNRRSHHLRIAASSLETMVRRFEGAMFRLIGGDLFAICNGASVAEIDEYVLRIRYLFSEDPLLSGQEQGDREFCTWFEIEQEYNSFLDHVTGLLESREAHDLELRDGEPATTERESPPAPPLDPTRLATIINSIAQSDLSSMLRRQPVCAVVSRSQPKIIFHELYISIEDLRMTLLPSHDILANRWLFQDLTRHLDTRMIALLIKSDDTTLRQSFSINLNIETVLSPNFLSFDAALKARARRTIMIELQLIDIFADVGNFLFARDFLHDRGYRICLNGTTHLSLPFVDRQRLAIDLVKLQWSPDLEDQLSDIRGQDLRASVRDLAPERLILSHCDSEAAFAFGRSLGIAMYQGFHLDRQLIERPKRGEALQRLTQANARNRADSRV